MYFRAVYIYKFVLEKRSRDRSRVWILRTGRRRRFAVPGGAERLEPRESTAWKWTLLVAGDQAPPMEHRAWKPSDACNWLTVYVEDKPGRQCLRQGVGGCGSRQVLRSWRPDSFEGVRSLKFISITQLAHGVCRI